MMYIIMPVDKAGLVTRCDLYARHKSKNGMVLLNENDVKDLAEAVRLGGKIFTEREAYYEINKKGLLWQ